MKAEFTPGPWTYEIDSLYPATHTIHADGKAEPFAKIFDYTQSTEISDESEANARLIAAAPDLLAACQAAVTDEREDPCTYDHHGYCQAHALQPKGECYMELMRAAIAKATS